MNLILNNRDEVLVTSKNVLTINEIREMKKYSFRSLVVKVNGQLVKRNRYDEPVVKNGDKVDIIHLISGG
ncbi:sulfur carrier protein ThiS [Bacteroidota bacterium]